MKNIKILILAILMIVFEKIGFQKLASKVDDKLNDLGEFYVDVYPPQTLQDDDTESK